MERYTVLNLFLFMFVVLLIPGLEAVDCPQRNKTIKSLRTRLSSFLDRNQHIKVMEQIEDEIYDLMSADDILSKFTNQVLNALNTQQRMTVVTKGAAVCQETGLTVDELLGKIGDVLYNNLYGVMNQTVELSEKLQTNKNMKKTGVIVTAYRKFNQFITVRTIEGIFCRLVDNFTPDQWKSIYNNFKSILIFNYTCTIPS